LFRDDRPRRLKTFEKTPPRQVSGLGEANRYKVNPSVDAPPTLTLYIFVSDLTDAVSGWIFGGDEMDLERLHIFV
jgi:hypothetical protein